MNPKKTILSALTNRPTPYTPIWIMRQAGRYLPEYRQLRGKVPSFKDLYSDPDLATEVTLMPLKRFPLDAAIVFSDILIALDAIGIDVAFTEGKGPVIKDPIRSEEQLLSLSAKTDLGKYSYLRDTLKNCRHELKDKALIGFVGSPWTLAAYAIEGQGSKTFTSLRRMVYQEPEMVHKLLKRLAEEVVDLALLQIKSGADVIQIFDSWAGLLGRDYYRTFSFDYIKFVVEKINKKSSVPIIVFAKGTPLYTKEMIECGCSCIGLDWQVNIDDAFRRAKGVLDIEITDSWNEIEDSYKKMKGKCAVQGNLDPAALYADTDILDKEITKILDARKEGVGHIFNLGHGIYPDTNPDRVAYLVDRVHSYEPSA